MRNDLRISLPMKNITVLMVDFSNMYVSYYGNVHFKVSLVSMLKDHVTLLNLLNLCGFRYPFVIFFDVSSYDRKNRRYYEYSLQASFSC